MSDDRVDVTFGAQIAALLAGLGEATASVRESTESMKAHLEALNAVGETVRTAFLGITAVLAGGELFKESIEKTAELGKELEIGAQKTGMAVEELSRLRYAANLSDVSADALMTSMQRLARSMESAQHGTGPAADAFKRLGISVNDATGHLRPMQDVLLGLAERFASMQDGAGKTAIAMDLFGRAGATMVPLLDQGREGIKNLEAEADRLGITMGKDGVETANAYVDAMKQFHAVAESLARQLGLAMMPALTDIAHAMTELSANSTVVKGVVGGIASAVRLATGTFVEFVGVIHALNTVMSANVMKSGEFTAAWAKAKKELEAVGKAVRAIFDGTDAAAAKHPEHGGEGAPPPPAGKDDLLQRLETQWLGIKEQNRENFGALVQMELDFWRSKLSAAEAGSKDYLEIRRRIVGLEEQISKTGYEGQLEAIRAQEEADKEDKARVLEDRKQELTLIRQHYAETSKEVQAGIARVNQAQAELQKETAKEWTKTFDAIPAAFNEAAKGIGKNVLSLRDLFREFFLDITKMSIAAGAASLRNHIATELAKKNITAASLGQRVALESWAAVQSVAKSAWAAMINIGNYAAQAIAGAWAAISSIPIVGPFMAPAIALGAGAAVFALAGHVHSAARGYDIPAGVNPMTQLHAQEMVLPAELANRIRGITSGGGGGETHFHVHAMDTRGVKQFMMDHRDHLADAVSRAAKDGRGS
jgi:TP901 family phage tail tape measure protein